MCGFFRLKTFHPSLVLDVFAAPVPCVINVDKNAAYLPAINELKTEENLAQRSELRQDKYLNNIVEQNHRFTFEASQ